MPWVGSSSRITRGESRSQRASTTFCWLPPERVSICAVGGGGFHMEAVDVALTARITLRLRIKPPEK